MTTLALEFRGVRETADFRFLAGVTRVDPISGHLPAPTSIRRQAETLVAGSLDLVLAYCSCAALGAHIAELSGARLVLIDPDVVTHEAVRRDFVHLCSSLGTTPEGSWDDAFARVRDDLAAVHGSDDEAYEMVDDLLDRYRSWLRFLDASASAPPAAPASEIRVIAGKPVPDLRKLLVDSARVRHVSVISAPDTLASPEVREQLAVEVARAEGGAVIR